MTRPVRSFQLPDLATELHRLLRQVPRGRVTTYGDLAAALGDRVASRWVGTEILHHDHSGDCPCHRVVRAGGELGAFISGDVADKRQALQQEGVASDGDRVDLEGLRFTAFEGDQPLKGLRSIQHGVREQLSVADPARWNRVAGVDVSYENGAGVAAYVELDPESREIVYQRRLRQAVEFPYISTYLAFRELPIVLEILERARQDRPLADVVMVDGSGILHPLRAGVATMVGVYADVTTIGVTKRRLYGKVDLTRLRFGHPQDVVSPNGPEVLGAAILPTETTRRPIYVSPGNHISVDLARQIVISWLGRRRLPDPIYWADRLSRKPIGRRD